MINCKENILISFLGGKLYDIALKTHGTLKNGYQYKFPYNNNIVCSYDKTKNKLLLVQDVNTLKCKHCNGSMRLVKRDGSLVYFNGDQLPTPASSTSRCGCGFKHYWDGKEYDNLPNKIPVSFEWNGTKKEDIVHWFQNESDASNNSNAFDLAQKIVHKHFPGEFGSERVVQKVVDQIFRETLKNKPVHQPEATLPSLPTADNSKNLSSKIILTGAKSKTIHKEELTASKTEQVLRKKIEHGAVLKQKRLSSSPMKQTSIDTSPNKIVNVETSPSTTTDDLSPPSPNEKVKAKRVRISTSDQGSWMYTLSDETSFDDIQTCIEEKFNIKKELQIIKYGFPPKTLEPEGDKSSPLKLKHGERLVVHVKKVIRPDIPMEVDSTGRGVSDGIVAASISGDTRSSIHDDLATSSIRGNLRPSSSSSGDSNFTNWDEFNVPNPLLGFGNNNDPQNASALTSSLFSLLEKVNLWPWACTQRYMFQPDGLFYLQAFKDLSDIVDNKHFSLPCFPNKLFSYNAEANEIYLCLGDKHIPVQPLSDEQQDLAYKQVHDATTKNFNRILPHKIIFPKQVEEVDIQMDKSSEDFTQNKDFIDNKTDNVKNQLYSESIPPLILPEPPVSIKNDVSRTGDILPMENSDILETDKKDENIEMSERVDDNTNRTEMSLYEEKNNLQCHNNDINNDMKNAEEDNSLGSSAIGNMNDMKTNCEYKNSPENLHDDLIEPDKC